MFHENPQTEVALPEIDVLERARVLLYNDDWHTFDEVIDQLIIAIRCSDQVAESMAWTVHTKGVCEVYQGNLEKCFEISAVLEEIDLKTEVSF
jgi:ATP-dependent Clp protease adapter protein ClpS